MSSQPALYWSKKSSIALLVARALEHALIDQELRPFVVAVAGRAGYCRGRIEPVPMRFLSYCQVDVGLAWGARDAPRRRFPWFLLYNLRVGRGRAQAACPSSIPAHPAAAAG